MTTPEELERAIAHRFAESDRFYTASKRYAGDGYPSLAEDYLRMACQAVRRAAALAAQRAPETVQSMETKMGLT